MISKREKAIYDRKYRKKNRDRLRASKAAYFKRTYDPGKAAKERKKRMPQHVEYCRQPKYRAYKRRYDLKRRASAYGQFADCYRLLLLLQAEIKKQEPDRFERYRQSGRMQWNPLIQQRRRYRDFPNFSIDGC